MALKYLRRSNVVRHHRYDAKTQTLTIEFRSGSTYDYAGVPPEAYEAFAKAESLGKHFMRHIRPVYQHKLVERVHG